MDIRGEATAGRIGVFIGTFIAILVGLILLQASAQNIGDATNLITTTNGTLTAPVTDGFVELTGQEITGTPVVMNRSYDLGNETANSSVFTYTENVSLTTGVKTININNEGYPTWSGINTYITYTYGPEGYIDNSGARGIAGIIIIFFALAIAVVTLVPTLREKIFGM